MKQRHFIFTHNNYTEEDVEKYKKLDTTYIIFGFEVAPTTGTKHLQGYFHSKNPRTLSGVRKAFPGAHIEIPNGPPDSQRKYCSKDGEYYESGTLPMSDIEKGALGKKAWDDAWSLACANRLDEIPKSMLIPFYKTLKQVAADHYSPEIDIQIDLHSWQRDLINLISNKPSRQIFWRWSENGGVGKSTFALYLRQHHSAYLLNNAKSADIAHALPIEPKLLVFDLSRSMEGHINYDIIEQIKNGNVFSGKYDSRSKVFKTPHVIIFANFEPNYNAWSKDRYDVIKLD